MRQGSDPGGELRVLGWDTAGTVVASAASPSPSPSPRPRPATSRTHRLGRPFRAARSARGRPGGGRNIAHGRGSRRCRGDGDPNWRALNGLTGIGTGLAAGDGRVRSPHGRHARGRTSPAAARAGRRRPPARDAGGLTDRRGRRPYQGWIWRPVSSRRK
ncbi:hypothetical protein [Streptomyces goshikiensis]|uniref:hypothetical protein n=1 Tax=Streptomyces goshikiensis TaxID=1942 RepID=UPI0036CCEABA